MEINAISILRRVGVVRNIANGNYVKGYHNMAPQIVVSNKLFQFTNHHCVLKNHPDERFIKYSHSNTYWVKIDEI